MNKTLLTIASGVALTAILLGLLPAAIPFRANRILYLMNAHEFGRAMEDYERLRREHPRDAQGLPGNFRTVLVENASRYYSQPFTRRREGEAYQALLTEAARRPELAPLARRKRLEFVALLDGKSSGTLRAAREILTHEGFDAEALWWAAYNQYDPARPLEIPRELMQYRTPLEKALAGATGNRTREQGARDALLGGLLALQDRNWAEAAADFERYRGIYPELDSLDLVQGLAALKAGRPASAIHHLRQYRLKRPGAGEALRWLAEAYLAEADYAWAAQALHEIRAAAPAQEALVLRDSFGTSGSTALVSLCGAVRRGGAFGEDVALWNWLAEMARTDAQRQAVDEAADDLIAGGPRRAEDQALLLQHCLRRGRRDGARRLTMMMEEPATSATGKALRRQSMERIVAWHTASLEARPVTANNGLSSATARLERDTTRRLTLRLPAGATMAAFRMRGTPAGGVWPIVHVDLGEYGAQIFYLGDSREAPRTVLVALRRPATRERAIEAGVSLLNSREGGGVGRGVEILEARAF